ncbi:MAG TPA: M56 family metallopeptidase [Mucilaginibacter sp.]|nr:M56 family metallopeptidase [Mucilaginibacter sp.]
MTWWQYLLLVNIYLLLFYGFYVLLLRSETFFQLNRLYLVSSALLSFIIPVIHSDWARNLFITRQVQHTFFSYQGSSITYQFTPVENHYLTIGQILLCLYIAGMVMLAIKLVWQLFTLKRVISDPGNSGAFSFFKAIRLGPNTADGQEIIAAHELAHARQWHSADIVLIEIIAVINWFNPVVYFYRFGIKHIHEFIADKQALSNGTNKAEYALLLLSQTFKAPAHKLVNPFFNQSLLKRRIVMLQKSRSRYTALLKYGLLVPLFVCMLILSAATISHSKAANLISKKAEELLLSPANPVLSVAPVKTKIIPQARKTAHAPVNIADTQTNSAPVTVEAAGNPKKSSGDDETVFTIVEQEPEFKGGMAEFYKFLKANLQYSPSMLSHDVQGKVIISLTVEKDGSLSDIKAVKDIGCGAADEAIRVLKLSPKWEPGYQNGETVRVRYTLPITFNLVKLKSFDDTITRKPEPRPLPAKTTIIPDTSRNSRMVLLDNSSFPANAQYVLDGKAITDIGDINPADIESIRIFRQLTPDAYLVKLFGPKALNGLVLIKTKAKTSAQAAGSTLK